MELKQFLFENNFKTLQPSVCVNNNNNNNNHDSTALYGLGPPLASSFRGY
jgi:hypothetical protein